MTDFSSLRRRQIELGQLPGYTTPIPSIQKSPYDINSNRNFITDGLVQNGFTSDFVRDLLGRLTHEEIYSASFHLPQIITRFSKMDKTLISVDFVVDYIKNYNFNDEITYRSSIWSLHSTQKKTIETIYSPPPLEKDRILLESSICLAKWEDNISGINNGTYPRAQILQENWSIRKNKQHPLSDYSDDFIDQIRKQRYAFENFRYLLSLSKLPRNRLEDTYNKTIQLRSSFSNFSGDFSISQTETIKNILKENGKRMRDAQNVYISSINVAAGGIIFDLDDIGNYIFSSPSGWGFTSFGQQTEPNQDIPYGNWRENIAELVIERIDCFVHLLKNLTKE